MQAITRLCKRVILLEKGSVLLDGPSNEVVGSYLNDGQSPIASREWPNSMDVPGGDVARLLAVRVKTEDGRIATDVDIRQPVIIEMEYEVIKGGYILLPHFLFTNSEGVTMFVTVDQDPLWRGRGRPKGRYISAAWVPGNFLSEGMVFVTASNVTLDPSIPQFSARDAVAFQVIDGLDGNSARGDWAGDLAGIVRPLLKWSTQCTSDGKGNLSARAEEKSENP
jgi:lipopolysaccharide transport system ATP-binding protein